MIAGACIVTAGSLALIPLVGVEFMPSTDEGEVRINAEMEVGTRVDVLAERFKVIEDMVRKEVPEMKSYVASIGGSGGRSQGSHAGEMRIALKPKSERNSSSEEIADDLREKLSAVRGHDTDPRRAGIVPHADVQRRRHGKGAARDQGI